MNQNQIRISFAAGNEAGRGCAQSSVNDIFSDKARPARSIAKQLIKAYDKVSRERYYSKELHARRI